MVWIALYLNRLVSYRIAKLCKIWVFRRTERVKDVATPLRTGSKVSGFVFCPVITRQLMELERCLNHLQIR